MSAHLTLLELDVLAETNAVPSHPHLSACSRCRDELAGMHASQERFRSVVFPRTAPDIERRLGRRRWRWAMPLVLAPALAVLVLTLRPRPGMEADIGIKGAATLRVFAQRNGRISEAHDGDVLAPGDALRFEIQPGGYPYLLVGSVDAAGNAGIIFPVDGRESGQVDPMAQFVVPGSAVLDAAAGPERAFALLSKRPLQDTTVRAALQALGRAGPEGLRKATALPGVGADAQLSLFWEKGNR